MTWTRKPRHPHRLGCRPALDRLEERALLSAAPPVPGPLPAGSLAPISTLVGTYESLVGVTATRQANGVDGGGLAAAVIDTGINYRHDALGDGFGPGRKVAGGHDFGANDADPDATTWQHGTAVAGVLAANGAEDVGVAPGAGLVALRVFGDDNKGGYDKIAQALQYVIDHHARLGITVVNLSISDGNNYTRDGFPFDSGIANQLKGLISRLKTLNIPVVTAAGNSFNGQQGMGFTAIMRETISVTATDAADQLLPNAQRLGSALGGELATDLAAPGSGLRAPSDGESYSTVEGTSFAAPVVSGAVILLQSIYLKRFGSLPSVDQVTDWLKRGADLITDATTGITLPRLNVARSAALVPTPPVSPPPPAPTPPPPPVSKDPPPPPVSKDPPPPPVTETPVPPQVDLYRDGEFVGRVDSQGSADPLKGAFSAFGTIGDFQRIDSWAANAAAANTGRAQAQGSVVKIPARGERLGEIAPALAAFRNRASLFRAARPGLKRLREFRAAFAEGRAGR